MCTTISQFIGLLWRVKPFLDKKAKEMFYTSIIMAKLRYCFTIWGNGPKCLVQRLYRLQKRAARIVLDCDINVPTEVLFDKLGWMTVDELLFYEKCIFMFKVHRGLCAEYLLELFSHVNINTIYNLRSLDANNFHIPKPNLEKYKKSIAYSGPLLWNSLLKELKSMETLFFLKNLLKKHIFNCREF